LQHAQLRLHEWEAQSSFCSLVRQQRRVIAQDDAPRGIVPPYLVDRPPHRKQTAGRGHREQGVRVHARRPRIGPAHHQVPPHRHLIDGAGPPLRRLRDHDITGRGISGHSQPFSLSIPNHPSSRRYRPSRRRIQARRVGGAPAGTLENWVRCSLAVGASVSLTAASSTLAVSRVGAP
jgi:hypothetical protein